MRGWGNLLHLNKRGHGPVRYMAYNIENLSGTLLVFFGYRPNTYIEWLLKPGVSSLMLLALYSNYIHTYKHTYEIRKETPGYKLLNFLERYPSI